MMVQSINISLALLSVPFCICVLKYFRSLDQICLAEKEMRKQYGPSDIRM